MKMRKVFKYKCKYFGKYLNTNTNTFENQKMYLNTNTNTVFANTNTNIFVFEHKPAIHPFRCTLL